MFDFNKALRAQGFVDSGCSSSRGSYMICSYKPNTRLRAHSIEGYVEVHAWPKSNGEWHNQVHYCLMRNGGSRKQGAMTDVAEIPLDKMIEKVLQALGELRNLEM